MHPDAERYIKKGIRYILVHKYIIILLICQLFFTFVFIFPELRNNPPLPSDTYRNIAYAQNLLNGNSLFSDPAVKGEYIWYPPLEPLIMAGLSKITGLSLFTLYNYSVLYINFFIPLLFFLFVTQVLGKRIAFFAVFFIPIMPWLNSHVFKGAMPSVHGFAFILGAFILFLYFEKKGFTYPRSVVAGIVTGLCLLLHSLSGLILFLSITLVLMINKCLFKKPYRIPHFLLMVSIPIILFSPYLIPNLLRPKLNPEPLTYFSDVLYNPEFVLYFSHMSLFIIFFFFALYGILKLVPRIPETPVLLLYVILVITLVGQLLGYIHDNAEKGGFFRFAKGIPSLIPHEFQWFFQLFILVFMAWAFLDISYRLAEKKHSVTAYILIFFLVLPGYITLLEKNKPVFTEKGTYNPPDYVSWILENTDKNDVFVVSNYYALYFSIQPYTARKILYSDAGYMNFNVNTKKRAEDKRRFLHTADMEELSEITGKYDINYCFITKEPDFAEERIDFFTENFDIVYEDEWDIIYRIQDRNE